MIARFISLAPLVLLVILAAGSFWLERAVTAGFSGDGKRRHDPDFWAEDVVVRKYGADGRLRNTLSAARMTHFPDDDTTLVDRPVMRYHRRPPVIVSGQQGLISKDGREIVLLGEASVVRESPKNAPSMEISTQLLTLHPDSERAESQAPVVITQGKSVIHGSKLEADNGSGVTTLHGPVRGIIHRKQ